MYPNDLTASLQGARLALWGPGGICPYGVKSIVLTLQANVYSLLWLLYTGSDLVPGYTLRPLLS